MHATRSLFKRNEKQNNKSFSGFSVGDELGFGESLGNVEGNKRRSLNGHQTINTIGVLPASKQPVSVSFVFIYLFSFRFFMIWLLINGSRCIFNVRTTT